MSNIIAVYPGTFDPVTYGHIDLIRRGSGLFSELIVAVAHNPKKNPIFTLDERVEYINNTVDDLDNVTVTSFECLLVDFARNAGAKVIIKGLRAVSDFDYELQMALMNRRLADDIEMVFMMPSEEFSFISSSLVKEIAALGGDIKSLAPPAVVEALIDRLSGDKSKK